MDRTRTNTYQALKLTELQQRFEELMEDDVPTLTLEDATIEDDRVEGAYNPYDRS
jgi:hypothetical protein